MISESGCTRLEPGDKETFFKNKDGKIILLAHPGAGANHVVDNSAEHRRTEKHFNEGDGWPVGHPEKIDDIYIWDAFKRTSCAN